MISKMNKLSFLIYHKEYEMFLEKLRELGVVHVEKRQGAEMDANLQAFMQKRTAYQSLLKNMTLAAASYEGGAAQPSSLTIEQVMDSYESQQEHIQALNMQLPVLDKEIDAMEVWGEFDWDVIDQLNANGWQMQFYCCPDKSFDETWTDEYNATIINRKGGQCYFVTVNQMPVELEAEVVDLIDGQTGHFLNGGELGHTHAGDDTGGADGTGADTNFNSVCACFEKVFGCCCGCNVTCNKSDFGIFSFDHSYAVHDTCAVAVSGVENKNVCACFNKSFCTNKNVAGYAKSCCAKKSAAFISCYIGILNSFFDIFDTTFIERFNH